MENLQIGKVQKIKKKTCPEEKVFMCLEDLESLKEINMSAIGPAIQNLFKVLELLEIKRPNLFRYYRIIHLQNRAKIQLIVKLTLDKLDNIPRYFNELKGDGIEQIKKWKLFFNLFEDEEEREHILGINGCVTYFNMIKENIKRRSEEIIDRQESYYFSNNGITEITILYSTIKRKIKLFGKEFVNRNKKICSIKHNEIEMELTEYIIVDEAQRDDILEIKLKGIDKMTDMRFMFYDCPDLLAVPDISYLDTSKVTNMGSLFNKCYSLISLPDISYWNIENVKDMSYMFAYCYSLKELPDISYWDTSNVLYMRSLFAHCISLKQLPDISEWNTQNLLDINGLFQGCKSLKLCPDISQWQLNNITDIGNLFRNCSSLKIFPDISEWDTSKVKIMNNLFSGCSTLAHLPDLSEWNVDNIRND